MKPASRYCGGTAIDAPKQKPTCPTALSEAIASDVLWRRKMLNARPAKNFLCGATGGLIWNPRLPHLRERALDVGRGAVCTVFTDASGACDWPKTELREGANWQDLWVLRRSMEQ